MEESGEQERLCASEVGPDARKQVDEAVDDEVVEDVSASRLATSESPAEPLTSDITVAAASTGDDSFHTQPTDLSLIAVDGSALEDSRASSGSR
jgi:hypothetical protein